MPVAATIDLNGAAARTWDVVVVGAGPAGALAARELARRHATVLLVDRAQFPRWKVCGCCLNRRALAILAAVGLGDLPGSCGAIQLTRFRLAANHRQAVVPLPGGAALSRQSFDAALVSEAIAAGAAFLPGTMARLGPANSDARQLHFHQDHCEASASTRLILAADGLGGRLLAGDDGFDCEIAADSRIGSGVVVDDFPSFYECGVIFMACAAGGYVGLVRLEDGRLDVATAFDLAFVKRSGGLGDAASAILTDADFPPIPNLSQLGWRGTPLLTRRALRPSGERVLAIGDAAGYIEPFTGEGISWALASGTAVAPLAQRAWHAWDRTLAARWSSLYHHNISRRQRLCRVVAEVLRHPRLTGWLVAGMSRLPALATPVVRYLNFVPKRRRDS